MIETGLMIRRSNKFWSGFTASAVDEYLNELKTFQETLKKFGWEYESILFGSNKLLKSIENIITDEIKYCEFYVEHQKIKKDVNFQKWVFTKKEDVKSLYAWMTPVGDQWTRSNGRIKATIKIDRSGIMTKLTLFYMNDNQYLNFTEKNSFGDPVIKAHLRNEFSINKRIIGMKAFAETYQREHLFPLYTLEHSNFMSLENLLCVESCTGGSPNE